MGAGVFLIAILGCGEAEAPCEPIRTEPARYESRAACMAGTEAAVGRNLAADYPVIVAECVADGASPRAVKADDVRRPGPGRANVRVSPLRSEPRT
jgi:hypothetical protein